MILLPYHLMDILSLFTRCCGYRWYWVSYWRTDYSCCPGWKTSTYQNCNEGKKIDRIEGNVRLWMVKVASNNIAAVSWWYAYMYYLVLYTGVPGENHRYWHQSTRENHRYWHRNTKREPPVLTPEYPERITGIDIGLSRENHWHWHRSTQREPPVLTPDTQRKPPALTAEYPESTTGTDTGLPR